MDRSFQYRRNFNAPAVEDPDDDIEAELERLERNAFEYDHSLGRNVPREGLGPASIDWVNKKAAELRGSMGPGRRPAAPPSAPVPAPTPKPAPRPNTVPQIDTSVLDALDDEARAPRPVSFNIARDASGRIVGASNVGAAPRPLAGPVEPIDVWDPVDGRTERVTPVLGGGGYTQFGENDVSFFGRPYRPQSYTDDLSRDAQNAALEAAIDDPQGIDKILAEVEARNRGAINVERARTGGRIQEYDHRNSENDALIDADTQEQLAQIDETNAPPEAKRAAKLNVIREARESKRRFRAGRNAEGVVTDY